MAYSIAVVSGMAFEARIAEGPDIRVIYGLNPQTLKNDIEKAIRGGVRGILSFGTAAGLMPSLPAGSIIIARQVVWQHKIFSADTAWASWLVRHLPASILANIAGVDFPLATVQDKSVQRKDTGATAADMESHIVGQLAEYYNIPFAALRVVLDDVHCPLPPAALAAATAEGNVDYAKVITSVLKQPGQLPALIQLARASSQTRKVLTRCGNLLKGSLFGFMNLREHAINM